MRSYFARWRCAAAAMMTAIVLACAAHAAEPAFVPSAELLAAARKEGKIVLYTANFLDTEQAVVKRFSQRFPGIAIEIVRAPTGSADHAHQDRGGGQPDDRRRRRLYRPRAGARHGRAVRALCAAERRRLSGGRAHDRPAVAALRQRLDHHLQLRAGEGPAEVLGRSGEARIRQDAARANRGRGRRRPLRARHVRTQDVGRGLLGEAGGAQADAVSEPGPDGRCHDPRRDRHCAAGHRARHSAGRAGRADQMVLRAGGRSRHGVLRRDRQGRRRIPMRRSCFSTGRCRARGRR